MIKYFFELLANGVQQTPAIMGGYCEPYKTQ